MNLKRKDLQGESLDKENTPVKIRTPAVKVKSNDKELIKNKKQQITVKFEFPNKTAFDMKNKTHKRQNKVDTSQTDDFESKGQQTSSGQAAKKLANWQWAEQMSFIDSSTNLRQTESTLDTSTISIENDYENSAEAEQVSNNEQNELVVQELETARSTAETTAETATEVSRRRRRRVSNDDPAEKIINYLKTRKSGTTDRNATENLVKIPCDRMDIDFLGYAHTVKKFSLRKQAIIKLQITQIITEAQLEELNNSRPNSNFSNASSSSTPNFYYVDNDWNISRSTPSEELQTHSIPDTQNVSNAQIHIPNTQTNSVPDTQNVSTAQIHIPNTQTHSIPDTQNVLTPTLIHIPSGRRITHTQVSRQQKNENTTRHQKNIHEFLCNWNEP
ncbi:unnamed protein product [Parnassius apollo]|uniref:(apollo) hypothetical protein n=1 Tax=Parnassius apollo TaxID=110799 RepID=A0A8S3Y0E6_PARAO|nr:unnamed protein product [Parnassius apollo]